MGTPANVLPVPRGPRSLLELVYGPPAPLVGPPSPNAPPGLPLPWWLQMPADVARGGTVGATGPEDTWAAKGAMLAAALPFGPGSLRSLTGLVKGATRGGFFSRVDDAVATLLPAKGAHPNKVASILKSNASAEELAYRNVPQFLAGKGNSLVTPAELQAHLAKHPAPVPTVKTLAVTPEDTLVKTLQLELGIPPPTTPQAWTSVAQRLERGAQQWQRNGDPAQAERLFRLSEQATEMAEGLDLGRGLGAGQPKYAQYQLPGGEAYRETLVTLPAEMKKQGRYKVEVLNRSGQPAYSDPNVSGSDVERIRQRWEPTHTVNFEEIETPAGGFQSGHFDEPNVLVHTRSNERTLPTGERGRFLEEVQSDWHQKGKAQGYGPETRVVAYYDSPEGTPIPLGYGKTEAEALAQADPGWKGLVEIKYRTEATGQQGVPDAPFKETWPDLGLKQQILETAADPTAQWIGLTSGQTQAARYDLSKQIDRLEWGGTGTDQGILSGYKDGEQVMSQSIPRSQVADYIGKEAAEKLLAQTPDDYTGLRRLSGIDLQVGGEGMRHFYDQVLPKRLEKILKPFGGTVERAPLTPGRMTKTGTGELVDDPTMAWIARLTPEMKARIVKEGLPLLTLPLAAWVASQEQPPTDAELFSLSRFARRPQQRRAQ